MSSDITPTETESRIPQIENKGALIKKSYQEVQKLVSEMRKKRLLGNGEHEYFNTTFAKGNVGFISVDKNTVHILFTTLVKSDDGKNSFVRDEDFILDPHKMSYARTNFPPPLPPNYLIRREGAKPEVVIRLEDNSRHFVTRRGTDAQAKTSSERLSVVLSHFRAKI